MEGLFFIIGLFVGIGLIWMLSGPCIKDLELDKEYLLDLIQQYNGGQEIPHRDRWACNVYRETRKEFKS